MAKKKISILCDHILVADNTQSGVIKSLLNVAVSDFEDGLEYYSALEKNCDCIVTENLKDFYFSEIEVLCTNDFFKKYMEKNRN